jgi:Na+/H+ antiporter NhaD/arsenite permease-like protein
VHTGVANRLGQISGRSSWRFFIFSLLRIICLSALINNVAAIAIFAPIVMGVARHKKWSPAQFLMPLAFGSILGGTCTLIGTSTNVAISSSDSGCRNIFIILVDRNQSLMRFS